MGKYVIFTAAVQSGHVALAVVGVLNAVIGAYYYLNVLVTMWMREGEADEPAAPVGVSAALVLVIAAAATLGVGVLPGALLDAVKGLAQLI